MPIVLFRRRLASAIDFDVPSDSIIWSPCVLLPSVCRYGWHLNPKVAGWYRLTSLLTCDSPQCVDSNVISGIRWLMAGRSTEPSFILIFVYGALAAGPTLPLRLGWEMDRRYSFTPIWRRLCHISVARITVKFHPSGGTITNRIRWWIITNTPAPPPARLSSRCQDQRPPIRATPPWLLRLLSSSTSNQQTQLYHHYTIISCQSSPASLEWFFSRARSQPDKVQI